MIPCLLHENGKSGLLMDANCVLLLWFSQSRSRFVSVVFVFNASLNDDIPLFPISFPADLMRMKKSGLLMNIICVLLLLS